MMIILFPQIRTQFGGSEEEIGRHCLRERQRLVGSGPCDPYGGNPPLT